MILERPRIINEEFYADAVPPDALDALLADGWRHFGRYFFRYNFGIYQNELRRVLPLRIRLRDFSLSKSQRRNLRKNADLDVQIGPLEINAEIRELFHHHKTRFKSGVPNSIHDFLGHDSELPTDARCLSVRCDGELVAASFFDTGIDTVSSIYGIFDPDLTARGLGIFTLLKEIEFAIADGKSLLYHGYAYEGESFYDYKKRFSAVEFFNWENRWLSMT